MFQAHVFPARPLCRNLASKGVCRYGRFCRFSHNPVEQASRPPPREIPCFNWEDTGTCPYGKRCAYLHRSPELVGAGPLKGGLLQIVVTLGRQGQPDKQPRVNMSEFCELASYDWLRMHTPTIAVPGKKAI